MGADARELCWTGLGGESVRWRLPRGSCTKTGCGTGRQPIAAFPPTAPALLQLPFPCPRFPCHPPHTEQRTLLCPFTLRLNPRGCPWFRIWNFNSINRLSLIQWQCGCAVPQIAEVAVRARAGNWRIGTMGFVREEGGNGYFDRA